MPSVTQLIIETVRCGDKIIKTINQYDKHQMKRILHEKRSLHSLRGRIGSGTCYNQYKNRFKASVGDQVAESFTSVCK